MISLKMFSVLAGIYLIGARHKLQLIYLLLVQHTRYKIQLRLHYKVQGCREAIKNRLLINSSS